MELTSMKDYKLSEIKKICLEREKDFGKYDSSCCENCPVKNFCFSHLFDLGVPSTWELEEE